MPPILVKSLFLAFSIISSAFDVIHQLIAYCWIFWSSSLLNCVLSYLTDMSQRVYFNKASSSVTLLMRGVPHGSVLGPLLFILYSLYVQPKSRQLWKVLGMPTTSRFMSTQIRRRRMYACGVILQLCRSHQGVDGKHPYTTQSGQDRIYLARGSSRRLRYCPMTYPCSSPAKRSTHSPNFAILVSRSWTATCL